MEKALAKVVKAGAPFVMDKQPVATLDYAHMIESGAASLTWEGRIAAGKVPPAPFRSQGGVGRNGSFDLSAIRYWLKSKRQHKNGVRSTSGVGDRYQESGSGERSGNELKAPPITTARSFVEGMRPKGETGWNTSKWIQQLLDGQLQCALNFWE